MACLAQGLEPFAGHELSSGETSTRGLEQLADSCAEYVNAGVWLDGRFIDCAQQCPLCWCADNCFVESGSADMMFGTMLMTSCQTLAPYLCLQDTGQLSKVCMAAVWHLNLCLQAPEAVLCPGLHRCQVCKMERCDQD